MDLALERNFKGRLALKLDPDSTRRWKIVRDLQATEEQPIEDLEESADDGTAKWVA